MKNYNDFLDGLDEGHVEGQGIDAVNRFPYGQLWNAANNRGIGGGLFIKLAENAPPDLQVVKEVFKDKTLVFDDNGNDKEEAGVVSSNYHIGLLGCSSDEKGRPRTWKDPRSGKIVFTVLCVIREAYSGTTPFKINYKGVSAIRMANLVRSFDSFVVGQATKLRRERNPEATKACRHQFWLPVSHDREQVGQGKDVSWAAPVQDLIKDTVREDRTDGKYTRTGVSVLKKFSDQDKIDDLLSLAIVQGKDDEKGLEVVKKLAKWVVEYKDVLKVVGGGEGQARTEFSSRPHFTTVEEEKASEKQQNFLLRLCKQHSLDWYSEAMILVGSGKLTNPPEGYEDLPIEEFFGILSKSGISVIIDHIIAQTSDQPKASGNSSTDSKTRMRKMAAGFDDDVPF